MVIGIDASRAFLTQRTGIEQYSYQVIKNLADKLSGQEVVLYLRKNQKPDFILPENWRIKIIKLPYLWTQIGLSLEMFFHPTDILFIPAHTTPCIHPKNTIVTIHGLEYEILPEAYSFWERLYMRWSIKKSCQWAKKIIAVSQNTKKDLMELYKISPDKIEVVHEGVSPVIAKVGTGRDLSLQTGNDNYLLFIGRLEERKNIIGIIRAFEILKERYNISHKLILAGRFGYGAEKIRAEIKNINYTSDIILTGFVSEEKKWQLMRNAEVFLFPTFYEGFGLPILEAQSVGTSVVAGDNSSIPEVAGEGAILVDSSSAEEIADTTYKLISDKDFKNAIIEKGYENVKRFSWEKCAEEIAEILIK